MSVLIQPQCSPSSPSLTPPPSHITLTGSPHSQHSTSRGGATAHIWISSEDSSSKGALSESNMSPIIHVDVPHIQLNVIPFYKLKKKKRPGGDQGSCQSTPRSCEVTSSHLPLPLCPPAARRTPAARSQGAPRVPFAWSTPSSNLRSRAAPQKGLSPRFTSCDIRATPPSPGLPGLAQLYLAL